jgi:hypothetical protein
MIEVEFDFSAIRVHIPTEYAAAKGSQPGSTVYDGA